MDFKSYWSPCSRPQLPAGYDMNPVEGLQHHQSESIEALMSRLAAGDVAVLGDLQDDSTYPFQEYPDTFDVMDQMDQVSEVFQEQGESGIGSSVSSDSPAADQALANGQAAQDNPGDTETSPK